MQLESFQYDNKTVRNFALATIIWGVVGMTVGLWVALQLVFPTVLNLQPYFNFGRIRPFHGCVLLFTTFVKNKDV
jgi:cytochrome c oxidase cbb3-type subunit I/II